MSFSSYTDGSCKTEEPSRNFSHIGFCVWLISSAGNTTSNNRNDKINSKNSKYKIVTMMVRTAIIILIIIRIIIMLVIIMIVIVIVIVVIVVLVVVVVVIIIIIVIVLVIVVAIVMAIKIEIVIVILGVLVVGRGSPGGLLLIEAWHHVSKYDGRSS